MFKNFAIATAAAALVTMAGISQIATSSPAGAQSYDGGYSDQGYTRRSARRRGMPAPGFEGFDGPGLGPYCTYKRIPNVKCKTNSYGESNCYTAGFRREQYCY